VKVDVRNELLRTPLTLNELSARTGHSLQAVSRGIRDIRNDPTLEIVRVPTARDNYKYAVAYTVQALERGIVNQARHMLTRGESMITLGRKMNSIANTPDDYRMAAEMIVRGEQCVDSAKKVIAMWKQTPPSVTGVTVP
jgi:DNA-binding transcriptional regulator GbsR (MarR family)